MIYYNTSILHPRFVSWLSAGTSAHYQVRWACPAHSAAYELESCCLPNLPNYELTEAAITAPRLARVAPRVHNSIQSPPNNDEVEWNH